MEQDNAFEIKIDFAPGEGDPTRVFKAMSGLVDAISAFDSHMANSFDVLIDASLVLDSVDPGSIKAKFRDIIAGIPDEQVKEGDWRKVIGVYLIRAKYQLLKWLDGTTKISHRDDIRQLEGSLLRAAEETGLKRLPAYNPPQINLLLSVVHAIKKSLDELQDDEIATYSHGNQSIQINRDFSITLETIREVLTKEAVTSSCIQIVKVKKPDYLGQSMWGLQYDGRSIKARILDGDWLAKFQAREVEVELCSFLVYGAI